MKHSNLWILSLLVLAVVAGGCKKKTSSSPETQGSGQALEQRGFDAGSNADLFTLVLESDPQTIDPAEMSGSPEGRVAMNIFEGLLMPGPTTENLKDPKDLLRPGVAKSYDVSDDGKTYTFHLRDNAKWSDGKPVTAQDFENSWKRLLTPGFTGDYVQFLWLIDGAEAYSKGENSDWSTVGIKSLDDHTLQVKLKHAAPYFPEFVAFYTYYPVRTDLVEKYGKDWTKPEHIISNGPYKVASYEPQKEFILEKNPNYWDKDNVAIDKAKFRIISDSNAVVNAYKTGELYNTGIGLPIAQITSLLTHPDYRTSPMLGTYFFRLNVKKDTPLKDPRVREALSEAIDRESLVDNTLNGMNTPSTSIIPPMAGWVPPTRKGYQIKHAKDLLAEAGYPNGKGFPELQLLYNTSENHKLIAETIQDMWKRNLGINIRLNNKEWKTFLQDVDTLNYDIARGGWIGDYNDPSTFLEMWTTDNGNNDTGWSDPEYDQVMAQSAKESDPAKRMELLKKAEEILYKRGPVIPIYNYTQSELIANKLKGYEPNNRDVHLLKYMSLEK